MITICYFGEFLLFKIVLMILKSHFIWKQKKYATFQLKSDVFLVIYINMTLKYFAFRLPNCKLCFHMLTSARISIADFKLHNKFACLLSVAFLIETTRGTVTLIDIMC